MAHEAMRHLVIAGAAGRDFHNFNGVYRNDPYPDGIPIVPETMRRTQCDVVVSASPIDLAARVSVGKPVVRVRYEYADAGEPTLGAIVDAFVEQHAGARVLSACED